MPLVPGASTGRRIRRRALPLAALILVCLAGAGDAQVRAVGAHAGGVSSRQSLLGTTTDARTGALVGIFVDVQTPVPGLGVIVEGSFAQAGGSLRLEDIAEESGPEGTANVRLDYMTIPILGSLRLDAGPVSVALQGGPRMDYLLQTSAPAELAFVYREESPTVFGVVGGAELELRPPGPWSMRVGARYFDQLGHAYRGERGDIGHRGWEFLVRLGRSPTTGG